MRRRFFAIELIACLAILTGATPAFCFDNSSVSVVDDAAQTITLPQPARRIVALAPNLSELVFEIGAGSQLVGVSRYSDVPDAARKLPVVGDAHALNLEAISALKPDLVLVWQSGTPQRQRDALRQLGLPVFESEIRTLDGMTSTLQRLGTLTGHGSRAQQAASALAQQWQALGRQYQGARPVRVFYQVWDVPLMTFNGQHLVSQAIRICGGVSGFDHLAALTPTVSREAVLAFNPQLLLTGEADPKMASLVTWRSFSQLEAVKHGQLVRVNGEALTRMSPRFIPAAAELCQAIDRTRKSRSNK